VRKRAAICHILAAFARVYAGRIMAQILLCDDDPSVLRAYSLTLRRAGHEVTSAPDGAVALEAVKHSAFDAIVSDISMPNLGGIELLRAVRERDLDVPVLLMTAGSALKTAIIALQQGASRFLFKPVDAITLIEAVRRATALRDLAKLKRQALEILGSDDKLLGDHAALAARFARALETMWLAWQPIVSHKEKRLYAYEALVRNDEPTLARPAVLLDAAERLGRLPDLGRAVRARVAAQVQRAPRDALLFVNLHPEDLHDEQLYASSSPLSAHAQRVVLEITERAGLEGVRDPNARVASLRHLGFRIAVDDLGAGYAGLSSFALLEPDVVKLDMSLVRDMNQHGERRSVVQSMSRLCGELGMRVIGEGIETPAERDALLDAGCDLMQGYLFGRPDRAFPPSINLPT
jgi:EAL domain-containing protein (putative c-di-GMP-specific phosphodiesterase class I)